MSTQRPRDMFGFDDFVPDVTAIPDDMLAADDRTLRLAAPPVTPEQVDRFVAYQRSLQERLEVPTLRTEQWDQHLAAAHQSALEQSGLTHAAQTQLSGIASKFCTQRASVRTLRRKQAELRRAIAEIEADGGDVPEADQALDQRLTTELLRLEPLGALERRYGAEAIAALVSREDELLTLHAALNRLLVSRR